MTAVWESGKTYVPGSLVRPVTAPVVSGGQPANGSFENGSTGWTLGSGFSVTGAAHYEGSSALQYDGTGVANATSTDLRPVTPGQSITASCMVQQGASPSGKAGGAVLLLWFDASHAQISYKAGNTILSGSGGAWGRSTVTDVAPANAAFVAVGVSCSKNSGSSMWVDVVTWDYAYFVPSGGLVYKAVQPSPGKSASVEPAWPPVLGQQVVDNEVIWEAVSASQIVWTARPINKSGSTEPSWPTSVGAFVHDGTIDWEAITPQVTDANCPHSKIVAIAASKVYAADKDIIRYSATVNPLDWTSANDAGYIPFGLQTYGSNPVEALNLYRSNLVAFNAEGFQMWQVDEDPASIALMDALPVGSTQNDALSPVANDLFFLSSQGVRTVGIAASSTNLQAGDVGMPIDPLVQEAMRQAIANGKRILSTYVPSAGQYWLVFGDYPFGSPAITGDAPDGTISQPYTYGYTALGGVPPYNFTITEGSLPPGLTINQSSGVITGTPSQLGSYAFTVTLTDSASESADLPDAIAVASEPFEAVILSDHPILYLPMDEVSGTTAADATGHGHDGTIVGAPTLGASSLRPGGNSVQFSGVGQYLSIANGAFATEIFEDSHAWSAEAIVNRSGRIASSSERIFGKFVNGNTGNSSFDLAIAVGDVTDIAGGYYTTDGVPVFASNPEGIENGATYIACLTYDGTTLSLYINGSLVDSQPSAGPGQNVDSPLTIGGSNSFPGSYQFIGKISDVSLYDYALTDDRVLAHAVAAGLAP